MKDNSRNGFGQNYTVDHLTLYLNNKSSQKWAQDRQIHPHTPTNRYFSKCIPLSPITDHQFVGGVDVHHYATPIRAAIYRYRLSICCGEFNCLWEIQFCGSPHFIGHTHICAYSLPKLMIFNLTIINLESYFNRLIELCVVAGMIKV